MTQASLERERADQLPAPLQDRAVADQAGPSAPVPLPTRDPAALDPDAIPDTRRRRVAMIGTNRGAADLLRPPPEAAEAEVAPQPEAEREPERILTDDERITARVRQAEGLAWDSAASVSLSSDGGFGGVSFFTVGGSSFVVKPLTGSMASPLFAEYVLGSVAGVQHTETAPLPKSSPAFAKIKARLKAQAAGDNEKFKTRWAEVERFYDSATYFLVQTSMKDARFNSPEGQESRTGSEVKHEDRTSLLANRGALRQLGATLVADSLLGNADRVQQVNGGNFFVLGTGMLATIDNEAFFPSETAFRSHVDEMERLNVAYMESGKAEDSPVAQTNSLLREMNEGVDDHGLWVSFVLGTINGGGQKFDGTPNHTAKVEQFDDWFTKNFVSEWMRHMGEAKASEPAELQAEKRADLKQVDDVLALYGDPANPERLQDMGEFGWGRVRADILAGYEEGFARLAVNMPAIRERFQQLVSQSPDSAGTMGADAFNVRAGYMEGMATSMAGLGADDKASFHATTGAQNRDRDALPASSPTRAAHAAAGRVDDAQQEALRQRNLATFLTTRPARSHAKVERVLEGTRHLRARNRTLARILLGELTESEIEPLLHIRSGATLGRALGSNQGTPMETAWDGVRGRLLDTMVEDVMAGYRTVDDLKLKGTAAYGRAKARATKAKTALNRTMKTTTIKELDAYTVVP